MIPATSADASDQVPTLELLRGNTRALLMALESEEIDASDILEVKPAANEAKPFDETIKDGDIRWRSLPLPALPPRCTEPIVLPTFSQLRLPAYEPIRFSDADIEALREIENAKPRSPLERVSNYRLVAAGVGCAVVMIAVAHAILFTPVNVGPMKIASTTNVTSAPVAKSQTPIAVTPHEQPEISPIQPIAANSIAPVIIADHEPIPTPLVSHISESIPSSSPHADSDAITPHASASRTSASRTGIIRVSPEIRGMLIDGRPQRIANGALFVTCGPHRVKLPNQAAHMMNVPCGRTVAL
jgi:hypothetical protein